MEISDELFQKTKEKAEDEYRILKNVYCPYLKDTVHFDTNGLSHIKFKSWSRPRSRFDQYVRLRLLHLAPLVIKQSHTLQGVWETNLWERRKRHGKWEKILQPVTYYEFLAVIGRARIKVIVRLAKGAQLHFWSIIPFWRMNEVTSKRKLYDGNPELD